MTVDRFPKPIIPDPKHKGRIRFGGQEMENPVKRPHVPLEDLQNLRSLAVVATNPPDDSFGYSHLNAAQNEANPRYKTEQSEEIWRRTLASLMSRNFNLAEIAEDLMLSNEEVRAAIELGTLKPEEKYTLQGQLTNMLGRYWPSAIQES